MKTDPTKTGVLIAGGGTGGHLFPGIAVAEALKKQAPDVRILFVGSRKPFEDRAVAKAGFERRGLTVEGFKGRGIVNMARAAVYLGWAALRSMGIVLRHRTRVVLGVGGYASVPPVLAGWLLGRKVAIQEQNALPGAANRLLGRFAGRVYVAFEEAARYFPPSRVKVTGNPVRPSLMEEPGAGADKKENVFTVLVVGGSQGARGINRAVADTLLGLPADGSIRFVHQSGEVDFAEMDRVFKAWGGPATVKPFYDDMESRYREADLVVCRSGATTIAELTALGKASVLVPFPFAADNHQEKNARVLVGAGASEMVLEKDLSGAILSERIAAFAGNPELVREMEQSALALGKPRAADDIAADLLRFAAGN